MNEVEEIKKILGGFTEIKEFKLYKFYATENMGCCNINLSNVSVDKLYYCDCKIPHYFWIKDGITKGVEATKMWRNSEGLYSIYSNVIPEFTTLHYFKWRLGIDDGSFNSKIKKIKNIIGRILK